MIDKTALARELKIMFIHYQYRVDHPFPPENETQALMIAKYQEDVLFHAKVDALTYGVMNVVDKHIK